MLNFLLSATSRCVHSDIMEFLIIETCTGIAHGFSVISHLQAEIGCISCLAAAILNFFIAIGISILFQLQAEICGITDFVAAHKLI